MNEVLFVTWIAVLFTFAIIECIKLHGDFLAFALGGLAGLIANLLGCEWTIQAAAFAIVSIVGFFTARPLAKHVMEGIRNKQTVDLTQFVGQQGVVMTKIDASADTGRVVIHEHDCAARAENEKIKYNVGDRVRIVDAYGDQLIVKK